MIASWNLASHVTVLADEVALTLLAEAFCDVEEDDIADTLDDFPEDDAEEMADDADDTTTTDDDLASDFDREVTLFDSIET